MPTLFGVSSTFSDGRDVFLFFLFVSLMVFRNRNQISTITGIERSWLVLKLNRLLLRQVPAILGRALLRLDGAYIASKLLSFR